MAQEKELVGCLEKECSSCEWHVTKDLRLDCNRGNRLGLAEPVLGTFQSKETSREVLDRKIKVKEEELKGLKELSEGELKDAE